MACESASISAAPGMKRGAAAPLLRNARQVPPARPLPNGRRPPGLTDALGVKCVQSIHVAGFCSICGLSAGEPAHIVTDETIAPFIRCKQHCIVHAECYAGENR